MLTSRNLLLTGHILSVVLFVGPVTVAASIFPRHALAARTDANELAAVRLTRRITRGYGTSSIAVPAIGLALAAEADLWSATWLQVSIGIAVVGWMVLLGVIVPRQGRVHADLEAGEDPNREDIAVLRASSGVFSLTWTAVLLLMVVKPW